MHSGVGSARRVDGAAAAGELLQNPLDLTLDGATGSLALQPQEPTPIELEQRTKRPVHRPRNLAGPATSDKTRNSLWRLTKDDSETYDWHPVSSHTQSLHAMLRRSLSKVIQGQALSTEESTAVFDQIMAGEASPALVAGLLVALRAKGETASEIAGAVGALRRVMVAVPVEEAVGAVDTCGTGGGEISTINISTAAAFVVAGAGVPVAKHGNRSYTSNSGSADVLEALGVDISIRPRQAADLLRRVGLAFLFAPEYHPAMRHVAPVRRELGIPTIMNLIGPLANPAAVRRQVIGVSRPELGPLLAETMLLLGTQDSMVVHGEVGMDEISPLGATRIWRVTGAQVSESILDPAAVGLSVDRLDGLAGGEPADNARAILGLLEGDAPPALRSAVLLNAAAALVVSGVVEDWSEAVNHAEASLDQGRARGVLESLRRSSVP